MAGDRFAPSAQQALEALVRRVQGSGKTGSGTNGVRALFLGPSGAEKHRAAAWVAQRLGVKLQRVDLARLTSKYVGETEKNLQRLFDAAHASGALLYFDESDALFGKRPEARETEDAYAGFDVNFLLPRIEAYQGVLVFAAYRREDIDAALVRRLSAVVDFGESAEEEA
ncbi:MAG TPA: ATP-binding protein [Burkholderiaceae bacterium]|nr:ATP-binding protein [Burkholderiaceae bacterium]